MNNTTVNILGTEYTLQYLTEAEDKWLKDRDGYCDKTSKKLVVKLEDEQNELDNYDVYLKSLVRHEVIHAFLFESGLHENWYHNETGHDETIVDWFATQAPKIYKVFVELGVL